MTLTTTACFRLASIFSLLLATGAGTAYGSTIYSQDPTLTDFTSTITAYGTFISGTSDTLGAITPSNPYTPTDAILLNAGYPRVIGFNGSAVDVTFSNATNSIVVFDNIDHLGYSWDVFQYQISGSNDGTNFTALFDPQSVNEANQPNVNASFTLNSYTGTAPTLLNNTLTPGAGSWVGNIGYEEYFTFTNSYNYYRFTPSSLTLQPGGENELELSAVGVATPSQTIIDTAAPEPSTLLYAVTGVIALAFLARRRARTV